VAFDRKSLLIKKKKISYLSKKEKFFQNNFWKLFFVASSPPF